MDFGDAPEEAAFRLRLREWLEENNPKLPASSTDDDYWAGQRAWHQSLYDGGFFGTTWPKEIGGQDLTSVYDVIVDEELAAAAARPRPSLGYLVEGILEHGSVDIKQRFLPGIVNGRDRWCQGFSEPDAGSDLASLRPGLTARAMSTSSPVTRSGRVTPTTPSGASCSPGPTPMSPSTKASQPLRCRWTSREFSSDLCP